MSTALYLALLTLVTAAPCCTPNTTEYTIKFAGSDLCLEVQGQGNTPSPVQLSTCDESSLHQRWTATPGTGDGFKLNLAGTGMCLTGGASMSPSTALTSHSERHRPRHHGLRRDSTRPDLVQSYQGGLVQCRHRGWYVLFGTLTPGFCVDTLGSAASGQIPQMWQASGSQSQKWVWSAVCG